MRSLQHHTCRLRRGFAYILAILLLAMFSTLAVAFAASTDTNLRKSDNHRLVLDARLAAESGLAFTLKRLQDIRLPAQTTEANFLSNLTDALGERLDGTVNLGSQTVTNTSSAVAVPEVQLEPGRTFRCWFTWDGDGHCLLTVRGTRGEVSRRVSLVLALSPKRAGVFDYGLASLGQIRITGHAAIVGANDSSEANVLSATESDEVAIYVGGDAVISGDLSTTGDSNVTISGSPTIGDIHLGVEAPDFPEVDTGPLAALATGIIVDSSTDISTPGTVFNNITIAAGTNPVFAKDVVINGIVYVEAPNIVKFEAHTTLNGMVVTEDNDLDIEDCQIRFAGHVEAYGVEVLPDEPEFAAVKEHPGTFILAPGFGVTFAGNFSADNGIVAADQLTYKGTAEGIVKGSIIGLKDLPTTIGGNVQIEVANEGIDGNPTGFLQSIALVPEPNSYTELPGE